MLSLFLALNLTLAPRDKVQIPTSHPNNLILDSSLAKVAMGYGGKEVRVFREIGYSVFSFDPEQKEQIYKTLQSQFGAEKVCLDLVKRPAYNPNDFYWPNMYHPRAVRADMAWDLGFGANVTVAVIDTGVDVSHPDLAANVWVNPGEIAGNGIDDDNNGYIDDVNGYDFIGNDPIANDVFGHGTACSGLVAAVQDNTIGVTGIAPHGKVMALKAATDGGYFYDSADIAAYLYAANNGARVLSMSFFGDGITPAEKAGMDYAVAHGVLPVAAAANDATVYSYYPGAYDNVLSVAALNSDLSKAGFSDFGTWVDVASPGVGLYTITAGGGYTGGFAGTSGACPIVAGLATYLFGLNPSLTAAQVRAIIEDSAVPTFQAPFGEYTNYGRIDCRKAAEMALSLTANPGKSALVRYMTPYYGRGENRSKTPVPSIRIQGRGFQSPRNLVVKQGTRVFTLLARTRDYVDIDSNGINRLAPIELWVDGRLVQRFALPQSSKTSYPMIEANGTNGSTVSGGFFATVLKDRYSMAVAPSGTHHTMRGTFRRVPSLAGMTLHIRRQYLGTGTGSEVLSLYDWSTASFPYGSFRTLATTSVSVNGFVDSYIAIGNAGGLVDPEGTLYFDLNTNWTGSISELQIDQCEILSP